MRPDPNAALGSTQQRPPRHHPPPPRRGIPGAPPSRPLPGPPPEEEHRHSGWDQRHHVTGQHHRGLPSRRAPPMGTAKPLPAPPKIKPRTGGSSDRAGASTARSAGAERETVISLAQRHQMRRAKHGAAGASQSARGEDTGLHRTAPASRPPLAAQVGEEKQPEAPAAAARAAAAGAAVEDSLEYSMEFESDDEGDGGDARLGATVKTSPGAVTSRAVMGEGKVDEGRLPPRGAAAESKERGGVRRQLSVEVADSNFEPGSARSLVEGDPGLLLDLGGEESLEQSFNLSDSGVLNMDGFEIKESGLTRTPEQTHLARNVRETLVKIDQIGRGASGVVHRALHVPSMRLVAVKEIPVFEQEKRRQMIKEVKALYSNLAAIDEDAAGPLGSPCPYNVSFYDAYIDPKESCVSIVVEYMDGGSLEDIVQTGGCAEESVLANISLRVLKGLHFIHARKQMHRDIKPSNLLINHVGDVKVSDFGIVRELEHSLEMANTFVGTLTYMSPERIAGESYSLSSDIWSFGMSIMTCALGHFPIETDAGYWGLLHALRDEPVPSLPEDEFSPEFIDFIARCLERDPGARPSAQELIEHPFLEGYSTSTLEPDPEEAPPDGGETARSDLEVMVERVLFYVHRQHCAQRERQREAGLAVLDALPRIPPQRLRGLARQLGLPLEYVQRSFDRRLADVNGRMREGLPVEFGIEAGAHSSRREA